MSRNPKKRRSERKGNAAVDLQNAKDALFVNNDIEGDVRVADSERVAFARNRVNMASTPTSRTPKAPEPEPVHGHAVIRFLVNEGKRRGPLWALIGFAISALLSIMAL